MYLKYILFLVMLVAIPIAQSSMQDDVRELKKFKKKIEMEMLRREANESLEIKDNNVINSNKNFKSGQTSQQALNPEISVVSDFYGKAVLNEDHSDSKFNFRTAGFHFQSDLDPFSKAFIAMGLTTSGVELGEAFIDYHKFKNINIRIGKFLQNFGVTNRWHIPSLDQWDNPLAPSFLFGGKLNQMGVSIHWMMPSLIASSNELFFEITNTQNTTLFHNTTQNPMPTGLLRLVNYYDINENSYLNVGISGMIGKNNEYKVEADRLTKVYGLDLTYLYEPVGRAHYQSFLWRSEFYYIDKEMIVSSAKKSVPAYGMYSYVEAKVSDRTSLGFRYDYVIPIENNNTGKYTNQYVPYLTFWQSPWVKTRLQYNYKKEKITSKADQSVTVQVTWAMGPHKHERY